MLRLLTTFVLVAIVQPVRADTEFLGKKSADWLKDLRNPQGEVRRGAAFALGKCAAADAVLPLVRALSDENAGVRDAAAYALGEIVAERKAVTLWSEVGEPLRKVLAEDADARPRRSAACAIGQFGPEAAAAREDLERALEHKDAAVRQNAAWALGRLKAKAGESGVKQLAGRLRDDDDATVRRAAAAALREIGLPTAAPAVRPLVDCLAREKNPGVRTVVIDSLVALVGPKDKDAADDLSKFLKDTNRDLRRSAALALGKIGGTAARQAIPVLVEALNDDDASVRELGANGLALLAAAERAVREQQTGPIRMPIPASAMDWLPADAVAKLGLALSDRSPDVRRNAALALTHIDKRSGEVIGPLLRVVQSQEKEEMQSQEKEELRRLRHYAAEAISNSGESINTVVPELLKIIQNERDPRIRQLAVWSLRHLRDPKTNGAADVLVNVLDESDKKFRVVRYDAARVLAFLLQEKTPAKAVTVLEAMLNDTEIFEDKGTDPTLNKGDESVKSTTGTKVKQGNDARYMAAMSLAALATHKRDDALKVLHEAVKSNDEAKKEAAKRAMALFSVK
jgi:HEAT repeat protein